MCCIRTTAHTRAWRFACALSGALNRTCVSHARVHLRVPHVGVQTKAFDQQTSVLQYLLKLLKRKDPDLLRLSKVRCAPRPPVMPVHTCACMCVLADVHLRWAWCARLPLLLLLLLLRAGFQG